VTTQYRQQFSNQLAIITLRGDTEAIRFDGRPVTRWSRAWNYAYAAFPVSHGAHYITVARGSDARFTAYAYGHSIVGTSSGAYGFTVSYTGRRMPILTCFDYYLDAVILRYVLRTVASQNAVLSLLFKCLLTLELSPLFCMFMLQS